MKYILSSKYLIPIILITILSIFSVLPLFHSGFFQVHDNTQVSRVYEMTKTLSDGIFPVRWVSDLGYGYGYPLFNFYSPFPYYIAGLFGLIGINILTATKLMFALPVILSGIFMYLFIKRFSNIWGALCGAIIYVYFPYHAANIYIRGDIGEIYSYALLPLLGLGLYSVYQRISQKKNIAVPLTISSLSLALIIISHNLSAYMTFIFLVPIFIVLIFISQRKKEMILSLFFILSIAFLLSAFYSLPALFEMKYTNVLSQIGGGANYHDHFVCLNQLWDSPWGFGGSTKGCVDGFSFRLGKSNILFFVLSVLGLVYEYRKKHRKDYEKTVLLTVLFIFCICSICMQLVISQPVWSILPKSEFLQYPWRFLNFTAFFLSSFIGGSFYFFRYCKRSWVIICMSCIIIALTLFFNQKLFVPQRYNTYPAAYYSSERYMKWIVSKTSDEYLPPRFSIPASEKDIAYQQFEIINGDGRIGKIEKQANKISAKVFLMTNSIIHINIAYFPAWKLFIDGKQSDYSIKNNGLRIIVPSGMHTIQFRYSQTTVELLGNCLTILGVFALLFAILYKNTYDKRKTI